MTSNTIPPPLAPQLHAVLELPSQTRIGIGAGSAMLVSGWCFHTQSEIINLAVMVNDVRTPVLHQGLVRLDVRDAFPDSLWHHGHALTSGFRTIVPLLPITSPQTIRIRLEAMLETGEVVTTPVLKHIVLEPHVTEPVGTQADEPLLIAICMAVYNPNYRFFQMQIDSIRAQTYPHWQCFLQDDVSDDAPYQTLMDIIGNDARFHIARNARHLGSFNTYEAALERAPAHVRYVTLASQDNIWQPDLLESFIAAFTPDVMLVTSDMIVIDAEERVLSETFWDQRVFEAESLDRLLLTNTVSGAATIFRREVIHYALPFPPHVQDMYDDQWIAVVALALGRIRFLDRALVQFRHHTTNVVGWPNMKPTVVTEYASMIRTWVCSPVPSSMWQHSGVELGHAAFILTTRRLWAEILQARVPHVSLEKQAQLGWIIRMDTSPRALRDWIRERGGVPRVTVNIEWLLLYGQVVERLFRHYARQHWPLFYVPLPLSIKHPLRFKRRREAYLAMQNMIAQVLAERQPYQQNTALAEQAALQHQVQQLSVWVQQVLAENAHLHSRPELRELEHIQSLRAWRVIQWWYSLKARVLPVGSRRERAYALIRTSFELATQEGARALMSRLGRWLRGERRYAIRTDVSDHDKNNVVNIAPVDIIADYTPNIIANEPDNLPAVSTSDGPGILYAYLDQPQESCFEIGTGSGILLVGWAFHSQALIHRLVVRLDHQRIPVIHFPRVRRDVRDAYMEVAQRQGGVLNSGFRVIVPLEPIQAARSVDIELEATLETGEVITQMLRTIELLPYLPMRYGKKVFDVSESDQPLIAICMATYNPNPRYLREQIASIRAQTYSHWLCLIHDDGSNEAAWAIIEELTKDDPHFSIQHSSENKGVYLNFEACLQRVPAEASYIAFCDQDDVWNPNKLEVLVGAFRPDDVFVYSDHTIIDARGHVLSETGWIERRHQETDLDRLLLVNHIAGSTCLFRAELLEVALPFPPVLADLLHDHWVAAVALTQGTIGYVEQPLLRYRQHGNNVFGWWNQPPPRPDRLATALRWWFASSDDDKANQRFNIHFEKPFWLTSIALWANVLLRRAPHMPPEIARQLQWVTRMDGNASVMRAWIRERGNVPRITLNIEWHLLYNLVAEHALARYAQRRWWHFNFASQRPTPSDQPMHEEHATIDYESLRHRPMPTEHAASIPAFWKALFPPSAMMRHVQEDGDLDRWLRTGREFLHYSRVLAHVQPSDSILDVGCGAGRMAMAFALYLQPGGRYEGFDVHPDSIAWAQRTYKQHWPHMRFQHIDLYNRFYNPQGTLESAAFSFPYPDRTFHYTLLADVFTHMLPRDMAHYWDEIARTLKPGGRVLATAFLLNEDSRPRLTSPQNTILLPHDLGVYRVFLLQEPERIVAYDEGFMRTVIASAGLVLEQVYRGSWCGRDRFLSYQDMMVVRRAD